MIDGDRIIGLVIKFGRTYTQTSFLYRVINSYLNQTYTIRTKKCFRLPNYSSKFRDQISNLFPSKIIVILTCCLVQIIPSYDIRGEHKTDVPITACSWYEQFCMIGFKAEVNRLWKIVELFRDNLLKKKLDFRTQIVG